MWTVYFLHTGLTPRMKLYTTETASQWKTYFDTQAPEVCYKVEYTSGFAADSRLDALYINERDYLGETFNGFKKIDSVFIYESGDASGWWYLVTDRGYRNTANGGEHWFALAFDAFMSGTYDINGKLEQGQINNSGPCAYAGAEPVVTDERENVAKGNTFDGILFATSVVDKNIVDTAQTAAHNMCADGLVYYALFFDDNPTLNFTNFQNNFVIYKDGAEYRPLMTDGVKFILPVRKASFSSQLYYYTVSNGAATPTTYKYAVMSKTPSFTTTLSNAAKNILKEYRATPFVTSDKKGNLSVPLSLYLYGCEISLPSPISRAESYEEATVMYDIDFQGALTISGLIVLRTSSGATVRSEFFAGKIGVGFNALNSEGSEILLGQRAGYYDGVFAQVGTGLFTSFLSQNGAMAAGTLLSAVPGVVSAYREQHRVKTLGVATTGGTANLLSLGEGYIIFQEVTNESELVKDWNLHGYHHPSRAYRWNGDHSVSTVVPRNVYVFRRFSEVNVTPRALTDSAGLAPVDWCRDVEQMFIDGAYLFKALNETTVSRGRFVYLIDGLSETRVNSNGGG